MQTPEQVATGDLLVVATSPTRGARIVTAMDVKVKTHATYRVAKVGASAGHAKSARRMATVSGTGDGTDTETESDETATIPATAASGNATRSVTVNETVTASETRILLLSPLHAPHLRGPRRRLTTLAHRPRAARVTRVRYRGATPIPLLRR